MQLITQQQLKALHTLFGLMGIDKEAKLNIIQPATSTRQLSFSEAQTLIKRLNQQQAAANREEQQKAEKMRRKIISMAHELHWHKYSKLLDRLYIKLYIASKFA